MNENSQLTVLVGEIEHCIKNLKKTTDKIKRLSLILAENRQDEFFPLAMGQLIAQFYTTAETLLFRIAQCFENQLIPDRWHKDLLEKMIIRVDGIRPEVLTEATFNDLDELRRFRHFYRNYAQHNLKLTRLLSLADDLPQLYANFKNDIDKFNNFLHSLAKDNSA